MNNSRSSLLPRFIRGTLLMLASVIGMATILASGGGGGGGTVRVTPSVDYSLLPTTPLVMSTSAADTSVTDAALREGYLTGQASLANGSVIVNSIPLLLSATPGTYSCPDGGTETITATVATPGMVSAGDTFTVSDVACVISGIMLDGSFSMVVVSVGMLNNTSLPPEQRFVGAQLQIEYNNSSASDASGYAVQDGDVTLNAEDSQGYVRFHFTGTTLAAATNTQTSAINSYSLWAGTDALGTLHYAGNYGLATTTLGGVIQIATLTPFEVLSGQANPSTGVATFTGASGNGAKLTAIDATTFQLDYEFTGDGLFNDHMATMSWSILAVTMNNLFSITAKTTASGPVLPYLMGVK